MVSGITFRSLIHFELIFVYGVRKCSNFILLQEVDQFSQHHLLKRLSFLHYIFLPPLSKISVHRCMDLSLSFLFCSTDLYFCLCARGYLFLKGSCDFGRLPSHSPQPGGALGLIVLPRLLLLSIDTSWTRVLGLSTREACHSLTTLYPESRGA